MKAQLSLSFAAATLMTIGSVAAAPRSTGYARVNAETPARMPSVRLTSYGAGRGAEEPATVVRVEGGVNGQKISIQRPHFPRPVDLSKAAGNEITLDQLRSAARASRDFADPKVITLDLPGDKAAATFKWHGGDALYPSTVARISVEHASGKRVGQAFVDVAGLPAVSLWAIDADTLALTEVELSGRHLRPARVGVQTESVFVSEPVTDVQKKNELRKLKGMRWQLANFARQILDIAGREDFASDIAQVHAALPKLQKVAKRFEARKHEALPERQEILEALAVIEAEGVDSPYQDVIDAQVEAILTAARSANDRARKAIEDANSALKLAALPRVNVVVAGALHNLRRVSVANRRLRNDEQPLYEAPITVEPESGLGMNAVGGGRPDDVFELHGAIAGQADAYDGAVPQGAAHHGASVGFSFKMPPVTDEAAAFALDGVRYFPIKAEGYQEQ